MQVGENTNEAQTDGVAMLDRLRMARKRAEALKRHFATTLDSSERHLSLAEYEAVLHEAEFMTLALRRASLVLKWGAMDGRR